MSITESLYFVRQLQQSFTSIGALIPTSPYAARAMAAQVARRRGPKRILEAGPGTGPITAAIVRQMGPDDELVLCELNEGFVTYLRARFERDPAFRRVRDQVTIIHGDVTQLDSREPFDLIVSAIPFNNLPAEIVRAIMEHYGAILKPDGVLTYIEYAYFGGIKRRLLRGATRDQIASVQAVLDPYIEQYQVRRDLVVRNVPPAWVRHLRLTEPSPDAALQLQPDDEYRRIAGVSTEAVPWALGLLGLGSLARRQRALRSILWGLIPLVATFFRDPRRPVQADDRVAYAASDGRVLRVERLRDDRFGDGQWLRIVVFLSLADVHINRSPIAGRVRCFTRESGGYAVADSAAAEDNQALYTVIDGAHGACVVAQRVGLVARRIVNWIREGNLVAQGERFGLIRFGSRTDVYLPADRYESTVVPGMVVRAGLTPIARLHESSGDT